jgi:hypothetical protein|nr:MAG TPA: hypothetical protein [Caudoviricetes sp.]
MLTFLSICTLIVEILTFRVFMVDLSLLESLLDDAIASETEDSLREWLSSIGSMP